MSRWSDEYIQALDIRDGIDIANVAAAGKQVERIYESGEGIVIQLTSGTMLVVQAEGVQQVAVVNAHG